jgi:ribosomal protein S18 acetylase RimI-like enzyme
MSHVKTITPDDSPAITALAEKSGLFDADGIELIKERLAGAADDELWFGIVDDSVKDDSVKDDSLKGVIYCVPEVMTDGTWNILMLIVSSDSHGQGYGQTLMRHIEEALAKRGARLVIVETSSGEGLERARAFYPKCGYTEEARIRNFYTVGADKIIFTKELTP